MKKIYLILFGIIAVHLLLLFNLRFTAWPEMLSYAFLRNHGYLLYKDMVHPYPPVLTMALSYLYALFGYKLEVLKAFTWTIILANDLLIFLIVKRLANYKYALLSLGFYILTQPFLEGNQLWFDLSIVPFVLFSFYLLSGKIFSKNIITAGFMLMIAALIKQTAGLFLIFTFFYLVFKNKNLKTALYLFIGPLVLGIPLLIRLLQEGALGGFINWVFAYPFLYWSQFPGYVQMFLSGKEFLVLFVLLMPLILIFKYRNFLLISYFLIFLILIYPRFSFFHLQGGIAITSILFGFLIVKMKPSLFLIFCYFLLLSAGIAKPVLTKDWNGEARFWGNDDLEMARMIQNNTRQDKTVYILGFSSSLYIFADRLPPKPWTDNFGWYLEIPKVQNEIINSWGENPPDKIVWKEPVNGNWYDLGTYQPKVITKWMQGNYVKEKELKKGVWLWQRRI